MVTDITPEDKVISPEKRKRYEDHMREYPPYDEDDPILEYFDGIYDHKRMLSTMMRDILDGKVE